MLALAAGGGFAVRGLWPDAGGPVPAAAAVPVGTAAVTRTDVASEQDVAGTLGFRGSYRVVNELPAGIVTGLPAPGSVLRRGQVLCRLSGQPVLLLYGPVPAWRALGPGVTPGPDVRELQRNLIALGFDPAHEIVPDGILGWATMVAIERWQQARGLTVTGTLPLGQVAFLPGPLRMTTAATPLGTPAGTGTTVLTGTSDIPSVAVSLTPGGPAVRPGDAVTVTMPSGTTTRPRHRRVGGPGRDHAQPGGAAVRRHPGRHYPGHHHPRPAAPRRRPGPGAGPGGHHPAARPRRAGRAGDRVAGPARRRLCGPGGVRGRGG